MKKRLVFLVVMVLLAQCCLFLVPAHAETATVTADQLLLHDSSQGTVVGQIPFGTVVEVLQGPDRNGYYQIMYKGAVYYVYGYYLDFGSGTPDMPQVGTTPKPSGSSTKNTKPIEPTYFLLYEEEFCPIIFSKCNEKISLRRYATTDSVRLEWIPKGDPIIVLDTKPVKGFIKVKSIKDGKEGYVLKNYISIEPLDDIDYTMYIEVEFDTETNMDFDFEFNLEEIVEGGTYLILPEMEGNE